MYRGDFVASMSGFIAAAASAPEGAAPPAGWQSPLFPILRRGEYNYDAMMAALRSGSAHSQVFLSNPNALSAPGVAAIFQKMSLAWTTYEFSLKPQGRNTLSMTGVLISSPVVFALNDAMWKKYGIAQTLGFKDRAGTIAEKNFTRAAWSNLDLGANANDANGIYHDFTSEALLKRGAGLLVCHNAYAGVSLHFAQLSGISHAMVLADWTKNTLPGFTVVPSGAMAIQLAQEQGFHLYPVTD